MLDKTEEEFKSMENALSGDVYIGCGETEAIRLIAAIIAELREDYPNIHYHLYSGNASDVTERLDREVLDFGISFIRQMYQNMSRFICLPRIPGVLSCQKKAYWHKKSLLPKRIFSNYHLYGKR